MERMMKTGFIGLGSQGGPMARRMAAAFPLTIWARRAEALADFADTHADIADSVTALGAACDHVGVCVVDDEGTQAICHALFAAMKPGSLLAIHSTILPSTARAIAADGAARGIMVVDAPVSGGGPAAAAGTLTVMAGGTDQALAAARPVFESFAGLIVHLGEAGAGQEAKIINNALMAAHMGLAHHAMEAGKALNIDRAALADLIKASSGRSFGFEVYARLPTPAAFAHGGKMLTKDVGLLNTVLHDSASAAVLTGVAAPFLKLTEQDHS